MYTMHPYMEIYVYGCFFLAELVLVVHMYVYAYIYCTAYVHMHIFSELLWAQCIYIYTHSYLCIHYNIYGVYIQCIHCIQCIPCTKYCIIYAETLYICIYMYVYIYIYAYSIFRYTYTHIYREFSMYSVCAYSRCSVGTTYAAPVFVSSV